MPPVNPSFVPVNAGTSLTEQAEREAVQAQPAPVAAATLLAQRFPDLPIHLTKLNAAYLDCQEFSNLRASSKSCLQEVDQHGLYGIALARKYVARMLQLNPEDPKQLALLLTLGESEASEVTELRRLVPASQILNWMRSENPDLVNLGFACLHPVHCKGHTEVEKVVQDALGLNNEVDNKVEMDCRNPLDLLNRLPADSAVFDRVLDHLDRKAEWGPRELDMVGAMRPNVIHRVERMGGICKLLSKQGINSEQINCIQTALVIYFRASTYLPSAGKLGEAKHQCREYNLKLVVDLIKNDSSPWNIAPVLTDVLCLSSTQCDRVVELIASIMSFNPEESRSALERHVSTVMKAYAWQAISSMYGRSFTQLQSHFHNFTELAIVQAKLPLHASNIKGIQYGLFALSELVRQGQPKAVRFAENEINIAKLTCIQTWASFNIGPNFNSAQQLNIQAMELLGAAAPYSENVVLELVNIMNEPSLSMSLRTDAYANLNKFRHTSQHALQGLEHFEGSSDGALAGRCWEKVRSNGCSPVIERKAFNFFVQCIQRSELPVSIRGMNLRWLSQFQSLIDEAIHTLDNFMMDEGTPLDLRIQAARLSSIIREKTVQNEPKNSENSRQLEQWLNNAITDLEAEESSSGPLVARALKAFWCDQYRTWDEQILEGLDCGCHSPKFEWAISAIKEMQNLPEAILIKLSALVQSDRPAAARGVSTSILFEYDNTGKFLEPLCDHIFQGNDHEMMLIVLQGLDTIVGKQLSA